MNIVKEIVRKTLVIVGSGYSSSISGNKHSKAEELAGEFVNSSIEEVFLSATWDFAIKQIRDVAEEEDVTGFSAIPNITDCLKVAVITPSNLEWYTEDGKIYVRLHGQKLESIFYFSSIVLEQIYSGNSNIKVPTSFLLLSSLSLASQISFALYSDSIFADGIKKQYMLKLAEVRQIYSLDYNLTNSGIV